MASTRNNNTQGNYDSQIRGIKRQELYKLDTIKGRPVETMFPGNGLLTGRMAAVELSQNNTDIENFLFGIRANDLTTGQVTDKRQSCIPELYKLQSLNIYENRGGMTEAELRVLTTGGVVNKIAEQYVPRERFHF